MTLLFSPNLSSSVERPEVTRWRHCADHLEDAMSATCVGRFVLWRLMDIGMQIKPEKTVVVHLTLTEVEARWLRGYVQNPHCELKDESLEDSSMRERFFSGLTEAMDSSC